ncbi:MAG: hypothetical protein CYPHOPRED_003507 [Cyphobasidiales sp. Tagirdzhanova-0007]|nr:MAG: hypothetical protein CYPHOPRED_003507 [Cyphobasidiales sp. Tagirdzhanova-0007]
MDSQLALQLQYHQQQQQLQAQQQQAYYAASLAAAAQHGQAYQSHAQGQGQGRSLDHFFALQQSQIEVQLQQMKMANLALQEQIMYQHQQQAIAQQQQQQHHEAQAQAQLVQQQASEAQEDVQQARRGALRNLQQARKQRDPLPAPTSSGPASGSAASNLDWQAERLRFTSPPPDTPNNLIAGSDGPATPVVNPVSAGSVAKQHHRKSSSLASSGSVQSMATVSEAGSLCSPNKGPALVLSKPGDDFDEEEEEDQVGGKLDDYIPGKDGQDPLSPTLHASMRSMHVTAAAAAASASRVGKDKDSKGGSGAGGKDEDSSASKEAKKAKRHTVILSSSLPPIDTIALRKQENATSHSESSRAGRTGQEDTSSSSGSSSPTSERSEVASFESANSAATNATSNPAASPTAATLAEKEADTQSHEQIPVNFAAAARRVFTGPAKHAQQPMVLNPAAAAFAPSFAGPRSSSISASSQVIDARYPSTLSLMSPSSSRTPTPLATPPPHGMRLSSAPPAPSSASSSAFGTPSASSSTTGATVLRQPKGPATDAELPARNFTGMIRRKAIGALKIAAFNGGRVSPLTSPVVPDFYASMMNNNSSSNNNNNNTAAAQQDHSRQTTSPVASVTAGGMVSPTLPAGGFAGFGAELAQRALKRRSQQLALEQGQAQHSSAVSNLGLGML